MTVSLQRISRAQLEQLAVSAIPNVIQLTIADGALPPAFVAQRALGYLEQGKSEFWCGTFFVIRKSDRCIVGGCGFRSEPLNGVVEIGYAIAASCQGQGLASAAIRLLVDLAFETGEIAQVLAQINPNNLASSRVVEKLGFVAGDTIRDEDNELAVQWWHGIASRVGATLTEAQRNELDRRGTDYLSNPDEVHSWDEVKASVLVKLSQ